MKSIDFTTIYNIPEEISGLGFIAHFIGLCLYFALLLCIVPDLLVDDSLIKILLDSIISSGIFVILGFSFIFICCPIYFFTRFVMELVRYKTCKRKFYLEPNIEYIKLNEDEIFFKNTCSNRDFVVPKQDIIEVILDGQIKSVPFIASMGNCSLSNYVEHLTLTVKTKNEIYTICPQIKLKHVFCKKPVIDKIELLKQQISFYKSYFINFNVLFDFD